MLIQYLVHRFNQYVWPTKRSNGNAKIFISCLSDSISLHLLLIWNLVTPSFRLRALQSGHKQGLMSLGGILHAFSLAMSLTVFVITSVTLGYQTVFLVPVPLVLAATVTFVAKSAVDQEFRSWNFGTKVSHCLVASIFPITSPQPQRKVIIHL